MQSENKDEQKYIDRAINEALHPEFEVTKQYLKNNDLELENGLPKVVRVDMRLPNGMVGVYLAFKAGFFLEVHLTKLPEPAIDFVYVRSANTVSFNATSPKLAYADLAGCLSLKPLSGWSKGENAQNAGLNRMFSKVGYQLFVGESYDLETQLQLLLTELEKDAAGVLKLTQIGAAYISVYRRQYVSGDTGIHLDAETIRRLSALNLSVDIDTQIVGTSIADEN